MKLVRKAYMHKPNMVKDALRQFVGLAANNTSNRRVDYFDYLNGDPNQTSKWVNFWGYQAKGGANYNLDNQNNLFANIGFIERAPLVASIFLNKRKTPISIQTLCLKKYLIMSWVTALQVHCLALM